MPKPPNHHDKIAIPMMSTDTPSLANTIADAYSLEVSVKDIGALTKAAPRMLPGSTMFIPYLPGQNDAARLAASTDGARAWLRTHAASFCTPHDVA